MKTRMTELVALLAIAFGVLAVLWAVVGNGALAAMSGYSSFILALVLMFGVDDA